MDLFSNTSSSKPWNIYTGICHCTKKERQLEQSGLKIMNQIVQRDTSTDQKQIDSMLIEGCGFVRGSPRDTITVGDVTVLCRCIYPDEGAPV